MQSFITFKDNKPNVGGACKDNWKKCNNQTETRIKPNCPKVDLLFKLSTLKRCGRGGGAGFHKVIISIIRDNGICHCLQKAFPRNNVENAQKGFI